MLQRRAFLTGLFLAAPAIVHAGNLMPIKSLLLPENEGFNLYPEGVVLETKGGPVHYVFQAVIYDEKGNATWLSVNKLDSSLKDNKEEGEMFKFVWDSGVVKAT